MVRGNHGNKLFQKWLIEKITKSVYHFKLFFKKIIIIIKSIDFDRYTLFGAF